MACVNDDNAGLPSTACMKCTNVLSLLLFVGAGSYIAVDARVLAGVFGSWMCHNDSCFDLLFCITSLPPCVIVICCPVNVAVQTALHSSEMDSSDIERSLSSKIWALIGWSR